MKLFERNGLCIATALTLVSALAGCTQENPQFDPRAIQRPERDSAGEVASQPMRPLPTTLESSFLPARNGERRPPASAPSTGPSLDKLPQVRMTLQEIIHRAVANNLDVKVAGYQPAIDATRAVEAEGRFDPTGFINSNYEHRDIVQAFTTVTSTGDKDRENILSNSLGIRQNLESGGQVELRYQANFTDIPASAISAVSPDPFIDSQMVLQITQPILQNFGLEVNRARIVIARNNQRVSLLDFKKQIEETTSDIEKTYWQLEQAERELKIADDLLTATLHTADILLKRFGQDVTRVQLSQANASVESRRAALIRAKATVANLSDQLKKLMNDPEIPVSGALLILPADTPLEQPCRFDQTDEINTAMSNRFELGEQQIRIDSANIATNVARNNEMPQLNLTGQVGYQGLGKDFGQSADKATDFANLNYQVGFQFEYPFGNRAAKAITRRALLQQMQAIAQYSNVVSQVALDVKLALREVDTTWNEMVARRQSRFAASDSLSAIEQREVGGEALTPEFVNLKLDTQERLSDARRLEAEAIANYNIALSKLELAKGTLLKYNNVVMEEEQLQMAK